MAQLSHILRKNPNHTKPTPIRVDFAKHPQLKVLAEEASKIFDGHDLIEAELTYKAAIIQREQQTQWSRIFRAAVEAGILPPDAEYNDWHIQMNRPTRALTFKRRTLADSLPDDMPEELKEKLTDLMERGRMEAEGGLSADGDKVPSRDEMN